MEEFQKCRDEAKKRLEIADHFLNVTKPLVEDPKLLLSAVQNLYTSFEQGMQSVLEYEHLFKNLSTLPESFEPKYQIFKSEVAPKHGFKEEQVETIKRLREVLGYHEEGPVEFQRGEKFVLCDDDYDMKTVSEEKLKEDVQTAKKFVEKVDKVVSESERIFRGRE